MNPRNFFAELKRRNVYKVAVAYAVVSWLLIQAASILFPTFEAPAWVMKVFVTAILLGFPVALILAWAFELTPEGIVRAEAVAPNESATRKTGRKLIVLTIALAVIAAGLFAFQFLRPKSARMVAAPATTVAPTAVPETPTPPEKSIAVLPFENLSDDKSNAYFADGIQDEILTNLAKVADLKVISRTSVMQFKDSARRNLRDIAQALNVAHVLEGSVQRSEKRVRVTAQLIDARTDTHLWAERYDRDLADVFAIQSEIAQKIVEQLRPVLSPREQAALQSKPTSNPAAYDLYLRGKELDRGTNQETREKWTEMLRLFEAAVAADPAFVPALCQAARTHLGLYWYNYDHTENRIAAATKLLDTAASLEPDAAEVHLGRAFLHYWGRRDYAKTARELDAARRAAPNNADVLLILGSVQRRQGHWQDAARDCEAALALDPRNLNIIKALANDTYGAALHQYSDAARILDNALTRRPNDFELNLLRAWIDRDSRADLRRMQEVLSNPALTGKSPERLAYARMQFARIKRDYAPARDILSGYTGPYFTRSGYITPRQWYEGLVWSRLGDQQKAEAAFRTAREAAAAELAARPDDAKTLMILARIDADLRRKELALEEAERARTLLPVEKDAVNGPEIEIRFAEIYAQLGETNRALDLAERWAGQPMGLDYGDLVLDDAWDSLRSHPRFQKLIAAAKPKDIPTASK